MNFKADLLIKFRRILKMGVDGVWRNKLLTFATIIIFVLMLLSVSLFFVINELVKATMSKLEQKMDLIVYFKDEAPESQILEVKKEVNMIPEVKKIEYIDKEEAAEKWRKAIHDERMKKLVTETFNPFPRSLEIKLKRLEAIEEVAAFFEVEKRKELISDLTLYRNKPIIEKLISFNRFIKKAGLGVCLGMGLIAFLIILNTMRITVFSRRTEIEIMRLVGGTERFILSSFVIEGLFYGVIAVIIAWLTMFLGFRLWSGALGIYLADIISEWGGDLFKFFLVMSWKIIIIQVLIGLILSIFSSIIAAKKYTKE